MDYYYYFNMSNQSSVFNSTMKWFVNEEFSLLRKWLLGLEISTAILALVINCVVLKSVKGSNTSRHEYYYGLLNLSIAQCLLSSASIASVVSTFWAVDYNISPSSSKDNPLHFILHNTILTVFNGLCVTGTSVLSWTQWWSLNIWTNHTEMPSGYRVAKVTFCILWLMTLLFAMWLNILVALWGAGLTTTVAESNERAIHPLFRIYTFTWCASAVLLLFSNLTSVPPVTGHLTARAIQGTHQQDCHDADCVCSDSEVEDSFDSISKHGVKEFMRFKRDSLEDDWKNNGIPTIITCDEANESIFPEALPSFNNEPTISSNKAPINFLSCPSESILSIISSTDGISPACNISIYSADISANSAPEKLSENSLKLSIERLHQRLQQLNNARPILPPDPESPLSSSMSASRPVSHKARGRLKKKKMVKRKFRGVKRIQLERPTRIQVMIMVSFVFFYFPPWLLLFAGIHMAHHATIFLTIIRLLINVVNALSPVLHGLRHPRIALTMARTWRHVYPLNVR